MAEMVCKFNEPALILFLTSYISSRENDLVYCLATKPTQCQYSVKMIFLIGGKWQHIHNTEGHLSNADLSKSSRIQNFFISTVIHINWTPHGLADNGLKYTKTSCILYLYYNNVRL